MIPGSGRSPGGEHDYPLQNSCLENPKDRGAWWIHRVAKSWTQLSDLACMHAQDSLPTKVAHFRVTQSPLQYSCLENPMDRGAWWAAVHEVVKSRTRLSKFTFTFHFGEGNGNPLQYPCLENLMDRGAWWAAVHRVAKSQA